MRRLLLVRHGETPWNSERRLQGRQDVPLAGTGTAQVRALAPLVAAARPDHVVCSPLLRCRQTADLLDVDVDVVDHRWAEADLGRWTGLGKDELVARGDGAYARWRAGDQSPPGGETLEDLEHRVAEALSALRASPGQAAGEGDAGADRDRTVLVVTHGGPIRAAVQQLLGIPRGRLVPVGPATLTTFSFTAGVARLAGFGRPGGLVTDGDATARGAREHEPAALGSRAPVPADDGLEHDPPD